MTLLFVLAVGGCGHSDANSRTTPHPADAQTSPPADGGYFNEPRDIVAKSAGAIPCPDLKETSGVIGARAQVTCHDGNIVVRVHDNHTGVDDQIGLLRLTGGDLLTGENWTVNAAPPVLDAAKQSLGGRVVHVACQPPDCTS